MVLVISCSSLLLFFLSSHCMFMAAGPAFASVVHFGSAAGHGLLRIGHLYGTSLSQGGKSDDSQENRFDVDWILFPSHMYTPL